MSMNVDKCLQEVGVDTTLEVSKLTPCKFFLSGCFFAAFDCFYYTCLQLQLSLLCGFFASPVVILLDRLWSEVSKEGWFLQ